MKEVGMINDQIDSALTRPLDALRGKMEGRLTDPRVMAGLLFVIMIVLYINLH